MLLLALFYKQTQALYEGGPCSIQTIHWGTIRTADCRWKTSCPVNWQNADQFTANKRMWSIEDSACKVQTSWVPMIQEILAKMLIFIKMHNNSIFSHFTGWLTIVAMCINGKLFRFKRPRWRGVCIRSWSVRIRIKQKCIRTWRRWGTLVDGTPYLLQYVILLCGAHIFWYFWWIIMNKNASLSGI